MAKIQCFGYSVTNARGKICVLLKILFGSIMRFVWEEIKFFHFAVEGISGKEINLKNVKRESADPRYVEV